MPEIFPSKVLSAANASIKIRLRGLFLFSIFCGLSWLIKMLYIFVVKTRCYKTVLLNIFLFFSWIIKNMIFCVFKNLEVCLLMKKFLISFHALFLLKFCFVCGAHSPEKCCRICFTDHIGRSAKMSILVNCFFMLFSIHQNIC